MVITLLGVQKAEDLDHTSGPHKRKAVAPDSVVSDACPGAVGRLSLVSSSLVTSMLEVGDKFDVKVLIAVFLSVKLWQLSCK